MSLNKGNGRSLKDWHIFIKVVELRSISLSAKELCLSIPAVSKSISRLEEYVNVTLFDRTSRRLEVTEAGWIAYNKAKEITGAFSSLLDELRNPHQAIKGSVKLTSSSLVSSFLTNKWGYEYVSKYPEANVIIDSRECNQFVQPTPEFESIVLNCGGTLNDEFVHRRLLPARLLLCASPSYLEKNDEIIDPSDLISHSLGYCFNHEYKDSFLLYNGSDVKDISKSNKPTLLSNNPAGILDLALQGKCIGVALPEWLVAKYIQRGELIQLTPDWLFRDISVYLIWQHRHYYSCIFKDFTDFIEKKWNDHMSEVIRYRGSNDLLPVD